MRCTCCLLVVLAMLAMAAPRGTLAQDAGAPPIDVAIGFDAGPATSFGPLQLGAGLRESLTATFGTDMRPLSLRLRIYLFSADGRVIDTYESDAVDVDPGDFHRGWTWITRPGELDRRFLPHLGEESRIRLGRTIPGTGESSEFPEECRGGSHALSVGFSLDTQPEGRVPQELWICLGVERAQVRDTSRERDHHRDLL